MRSYFRTFGSSADLPGMTAWTLALTVGLILSLVGLLLPLQSLEHSLTLLGGLVLGSSLLLVLLNWPPLGLVILAAGGLTIPLQLGTGSRTALNASFLLAPCLVVIWILGLTMRRSGAPVDRSRPIVSLLAFMTAAAAAFLMGQFPWFASTPAPFLAQVAGLAIFLLSGGVFLVAAHQLRDPVWLSRVTWVFVLLGGLYILSWYGPDFSDYLAAVVSRGSTGSLFWTWLVALAFGQAVFNTQLRWPVRAALLGLVAAALGIGLFLSGSWASGWLPALVALFVAVLAGMRRLAVPFVVASGSLVALFWDRLSALLFTGDQQYSLMTRLEAWKVLTDIIAVNPVLGLGPANYYHYTQLFPIMGWYVKFNSHNNFVDILAQTGLIGLALFLWFAWEMLRMAWRLTRRHLRGFSRGYAFGALGGLAGTLAAAMLGDWVIPFVYNVGVEGFRSSCLAWIFLGGLAALDWNVRNSS